MTIKKCSCENDYQDEKYGENMRVFNETAKGHRCTVCDKDINKSGEQNAK